MTRTMCAILLAVFLLAHAAPARGDELGFTTVFGTGENKFDVEQVAMQVCLPSDATVTSMTAYLQAGPPPSTNVRYAIYTDVNGQPDTLIVQSATESKGSGNLWRTLDLPDTPLLGGTYWLAMTTDHPALKYRYEESCSQVRHMARDAINNGFAPSWGASITSEAWRISMFATMTLGAPSGRFENVSSLVGFNIATSTSDDEGSGLHWADLDNDGDLDVIITGDHATRLVNNAAGASFSVSTFGDGSPSRQGALLDADQDGDLDFWHRANMLYDNDGGGGFTGLGAAGFGNSVGATNEGIAAGDVDRDGFCDLVVFANDANWIGHHDGTAPASFTGTSDIALGLNTVGDYGDGDYVAAGDVNHDGYPDFFYHYAGGRLFRSDGDGSYTENSSGISITTDVTRKIGSAWGDYDNDGDLDLFVPRFDPGSTGWLWRNDSGLFTNVAAGVGLTDTSGQRSGCWGDYDNDGDLDLYVVTHSGAPNVLYRNNGLGSFVAVDDGAGVYGEGQDAVFVDYDNDGDLDLAVTNGCATNLLLKNTTDTAAYLKVRLVGWGAGGTSPAAIGTRIELFASDGTTLLGRRDVGVARGYAGAEPLWVHFGGVSPGIEYVVRVHFNSRVHDVTVDPATVSTVIGSRTIAQMLTVVESRPALRLIRWQETDPMVP